MSFFNTFSKPIKNYLGKNPPSTEVEPISIDKLSTQGSIARWGDNNKFPQDLDEKLKNSISMEAGIQSLTEFGCGIRLSTYFREADASGKLVRYPVHYQPFEDFREEYAFEEVYLQRAFYNFWRYGNTFCELSIGADRKIIRLFTKDSPYCRISTLNPNTGLSEKLFISAQWTNRSFGDSDISGFEDLKKKNLIDEIPLIDYRDPLAYIRRSQSNRLGWHIKDYSPGNPYYGQSPWYPILENGWLDIETSAPKLLKAYYNNLITIAQHIELNIDFISTEIDNWDSLTSDEKTKALTEMQERIESHLVGGDQSFKTLFSQFRVGKGGDIESSIRINDIKNPMRDSNVLNDLKYASTVAQTALRIDDSLTGNKSTGSLEADAGSEKRMAGNLLNARLEPVRKQILFPLVMTKRTNDWDPRLEFVLEFDYLMTTDKSFTGKSSAPIPSN